MTLRIVVTFPFGTFDASATRFSAEWPPSPARLLSGLRADAQSQGELAALRWLERQPPPRVYAAQRPLGRRHEQGYVVTNRVARKGTHQQHAGRTATLRQRQGVLLSDERVAFVWPDAHPPGDTLTVLDGLAARLPYLGRSTSVVIANVDNLAEDTDGWFEPAPLGADTFAVPAPYEGMVDALSEAFDAGARAWETYRSIPYRYARTDEPVEAGRAAVASGPFRDILVFGFPPGVHVAANLLGNVTLALRRAVMDCVADPLPAPVSGHGADDRTHAAFLGLPFVGHHHADGHLLGVGIALPDLTDVEMRAVASGLLGDDGLRRLSIPRVGQLPVTFDPARQSPFGLRPERWIRDAREWVTATPLILDRHPHRREDPADIVAAGCVTAGYPEPAFVELARRPLLDGGLDLRPHQLPRRSGDRRPYLHARVVFDRPVRGPVLLGGLRYLGFGLCVPVTEPAGGDAS